MSLRSRVEKLAKRFLGCLLCTIARAEELSDAELRRRWRRARGVLLLCGAGIGDALMAMPLVTALRHRYPHLRLGIATRTQLSPLFAHLPELSLFAYPDSWGIDLLRFLRRCRRFGADVFLAAQPTNTFRHALIAGMSGASLRLKHAYPPTTPAEDRLPCLYHRLLPNDTQRHRVELNLDLLRVLGEDIPEGSIRPRYDIPEALQLKVREWLPTTAPLVAFHLGSGRPEKCWPLEHFVAVAQWLLRQGYHVLVLGSAAEKSRAEAFRRALNAPVWDFTGRTELPEAAALLRHCRLMVSNDSGLMHLAAAVGIPVVALFVATSPTHIGPYAPNALALGTAGRPPTVEEVLQALHRLTTAEGRNAGI